MVRELLHREFSWRAAPYLALATAVIWLVVLLSWPPPHDNGLMPMVFCILGFTGDTQRRVSQYEAALPIPGRQLVAARLIGRLSLLWLGTFAVVAVTSEFGSPKDILTLLLAAACFTLGILAEQSVRVHDAAPPRYGFLLGMVPLVILLWPKRGPSEKTVMAILLAASAALVVRLWMTIPDGFQLAPDKLMRTRRFNMGRWISGRFQTPMWWPACRSALGNWGMVVFVLPGYLGGGGCW
jgi:hypothetical protein